MDEQIDQETIAHWQQSIEKFIIEDIRKCIEHDFLESGLIILTLAGVECISGYFCGRKADQNTFCAFFDSKYFRNEYTTYSTQIYQCLRNGLVHDHTNKNNVFTLFRKVNDAPHLQKIYTDKGETISFNRENFANDLLNAWKTYSEEVFTDPRLAQNVIKRIGDKNRGFLVVKDTILHQEKNGKSQQQKKYFGGTVGWWEQ